MSNGLNYGLTGAISQAALQVVPGNIIATVTPGVEVATGFSKGPGAITIGVSVDQHALSFYIREVTASDLSTKYELVLAGSLFFNAVITGLVPTNPAYSDGPVNFNNYGDIFINEVLGTFDNIYELQQAINNFSISTEISQIIVIEPDGTVTPFDSTNPDPFNSVFTGEQKVTIHATTVLTITTGNVPTS